MDPLTIEIIKAVGPPGVFSVLLWVLLREQLRASREESQKERDRNDANIAAERTRNDASLAVHWAKMDGLKNAFEQAKCRYTAQE